eukprot:14263-Heterococcus_DN1.PRE.2
MSVANASAEHLCRKMKLDNTQTKHTFHLLPVDIQRMIVVMAGYLVSTRSDSLNCGCSLTEAAFGKTFASNRLMVASGLPGRTRWSILPIITFVSASIGSSATTLSLRGLTLPIYITYFWLALTSMPSTELTLQRVAESTSNTC